MKTTTTDMLSQVMLSIHNEIRNSYSSESEAIIEKLDTRLIELEEATNDDFQISIQRIIYPFLACMDALEASGKSRGEATGFVNIMLEKIDPEIFK